MTELKYPQLHIFNLLQASSLRIIPWIIPPMWLLKNSGKLILPETEQQKNHQSQTQNKFVLRIKTLRTSYLWIFGFSSHCYFFLPVLPFVFTLPSYWILSMFVFLILFLFDFLLFSLILLFFLIKLEIYHAFLKCKINILILLWIPLVLIH